MLVFISDFEISGFLISFCSANPQISKSRIPEISNRQFLLPTSYFTPFFLISFSLPFFSSLSDEYKKHKRTEANDVYF